MEIRDWLDAIGLGEFAAAFEREQVRVADVRELSEPDLKELGLPLGPRKRFLKAAQGLHGVERAAPAAQQSGPEIGAAADAYVDLRPVTVLFADVKGFTALGERLEAEDLRSLQSDVHREMAAIIAHYGGFLEKFVGDAALALFGAPVAHEDDATRALRAALALRERIRSVDERWRSRLDEPLALHMGINSGPVVAGTLGAGREGAYAVTGDVVNTAARLQSAADRDEILVGASTYHLTEDLFAFDALGGLEAKGKKALVQAYRLRGVRPRPRSAGGFHAPLVGRDSELSQMLDVLRQARRGRAQLVRVFGEAGCGKTRLVEEFVGRVGGEATVLRAACSAFGDQTFGALAGLLRDHFAIEHDDPSARIREKLGEGLNALGVDAAERTPLAVAIELVMGMPGSGIAPEQLEPEQLKSQIFVAARMLIEQRLVNGPLLLVLEDLHWADAASIDCLRYLVDRLNDQPLMVLVSHRPEFAADRLTLCRASQAALRLNQLSSADSDALLRGLFDGCGDLLPEGLRRFVIERSGGNPMYLAEIMRSLLESGVLVRGPDRWSYSGASLPCDVPMTIRGLLLSRIDRLAVGPRRIVQEAAVLGITFSARVLARITATAVSELDHALEALCAADLIREVRAGASSGTRAANAMGKRDLGYRFTHAIVQEVAYQNLLVKQRELLHGRVAHVLSVESRDALERPEDVELLAHHFALSNAKPQAIRYLLEAGDRARRVYANDDGLRHYRRALAIVEDCGGPVADRLAVLERLADLLALMGEREAALRHLQAVIDADATAQATDRARLHRKAAVLHWEGGARDRANAELQDALQLLSDDSSIERALLCQEVARLAFRSGDQHGAMQWAERAIGEAQPFLGPADDRPESAEGAAVSSAAAVLAEANNTLGVARARLGQTDAAILDVERSLAMAAAHGLDQAVCRACANLAILYGPRDPGRAIELSHRGLEVAKKVGHLGFQSTLYTNLGMSFCTFHARNDREGLEAVKRSIELDRQLNLLDHLPMPLIALGQLYQCHGRPQEAIGCFREALALAETLGEPQMLYHCYDGLAAALLDVDDFGEARNFLRKGQELCARTGISPGSLLVMPFLV